MGLLAERRVTTSQAASSPGLFAERRYPSLRPLAWARLSCLIFAGLMILIAVEGHVYHIPAFYALAGDSVASLPTLLAAGLSLVATIKQRPLQRPRQTEAALWLAVIAVCLVTGLSYRMGLSLGVGEMGGNTAVSFLLLSLGQLSYRRLGISSFALALMALLLPFVSLVGYMNWQSDLFGAMSLSTALILLALGVANVTRYARRREMRALTSTTPAAEVVRVMLLFWCAWLLTEVLALRLVRIEHAGIANSVLMVVNAMVSLGVIAYLGMRMNDTTQRLRVVERRLHDAMLRDPLTGIEPRAAAELYAATLGLGTRLGLIRFEIDDFRRLRATRGPIAAQRMVTLLATGLRARLTPDEQLTHSPDGGFLLLTRNMPLDALEVRAQEIRGFAAALRDPQEEVARVTVSAGVALTRRGDTELAWGLQRADRALEEARAAGCDRVVSIRDAA